MTDTDIERKTASEAISEAEAAEIEAVRKALDEGYPEMWVWPNKNDPEGEPGDGRDLIGYAVRKETGKTKFGMADILIMRVNGELRSVWLVHTALLSKLQRQRPAVGDLIGIRWLGERDSKEQTYLDFHVYVHSKQGSEMTWEAPAELPAAEEDVVDAEVVDSPAKVPTDW